MGFFRPYERSNDKPAVDARTSDRRRSLVGGATRHEPPAAAPAPPTPDQGPTTVRRTPAKKETATRTRAQAEAERMERRHPTLDPKQQRKADREARTAARLDAWDRMEAAPERVLLRDYVDARWTAAEFMMPIMLVGMAAFLLTSWSVEIVTWVALGMWALLFICIINVAILWRGFRRLLAERLPQASRRGLLMYLLNRAIMIRRFRRPGPRIPRGGQY